MYIVCEGETPWDNGLLGHITYCTGIGVDKKYFPFKSKEKYLAPFVAVQFKNAVRTLLLLFHGIYLQSTACANSQYVYVFSSWNSYKR